MKNKVTVIKEQEMPEHDNPAVLAYRVGQLENNQKERFNRLEKKIDDMTTGFVTIDKLNDAKEAADDKHREQDGKIRSLEEWNIWAQRLVLGAVILAILAIVLEKTHVF